MTDSSLPESPESLLLRRSKIRKTLPPLEETLRGSLLRREIRCGKPTCRCVSGPGHTFLVLSVTFPGGRTRQVTVPAELSGAVELWIHNYRLWWQAIEDVSEINRRLLQLRRMPQPSLPRRTPRAPRSRPRRAPER